MEKALEPIPNSTLLPRGCPFWPLCPGWACVGMGLNACGKVMLLLPLRCQASSAIVAAARKAACGLAALLL